MKRNICISFLIVCILFTDSILCAKCPTDSSKWCKSIQTAKDCNVVDQCFKFVWTADKDEEKVSTSVLVNFTLYYETLCPDCREFMSGELWRAFQSVSSIMNLTIVPYGNAKETWRNETKLWQFTCQHGPDECWGNLFHSCFINYYPQTSQHLPLIHCMESDSADDIRSAAQKCAKQFSINTDQIDKCMNSRLGNTIQHANAVKTEQLNPPHKYVPWVTLNGVHTEDIQDKAQKDLVKLICDTYTGPNKPQACN